MQPYLPSARKTRHTAVRAGICAWLTLLLTVAGDGVTAREVAGWIERVRLEPSGLELQAKLDTGAETSSLHAEQIEAYSREGRQYLRFSVANRQGESRLLEGPLVRRVKIKRHTGASQVRPVILLQICLGGVRKEAEVNLVDRGRFNYPLLIGRSFLAGDFLIDSDRTFLLEPICGSGNTQ